MIVIGLTGSIAMGKSETARMFAEQGIPVFDSDAAVHALYARGGEGAAAISRIAPAAIVDGAVDRARLAAAIQQDPVLLRQIEQAIHPLVRKNQEDFLEQATAAAAYMAVLDIPLLFETGREKEVDCIVVVSAPSHVQEERALKRPGMTREKLAFILSRQVPDAEKRARADYVIDTSQGLDSAREQVRQIISALKNRKTH